MVLQTDMQQHFATTTRFKLRQAVVRDWGNDLADISLVLSMAIKVGVLGRLNRHLTVRFHSHVGDQAAGGRSKPCLEPISTTQDMGATA